MNNAHRDHRISPGSVASLSPAPVGQPGSFAQDQNVDGENAPVDSAVKNGSPLPRATGHHHQSDFRIIIAIDPGATGGIAFQGQGEPAEAVAMPGTEGDLIALLRELAADPTNTVGIVEEVSGYVGKAQPASSAFKFGRNFGFTLGDLQTLGVRLELVRPQTWQKALSLGTASGCASKTIWKNKLKACAQRLYPRLHVTLNTADALLILEYSRTTTVCRDRSA